VLGLMSKETALVVPVAIAGLCLLVAPWRGWWWSLLVTGLIAGIYLALRLHAMLDVPAEVTLRSLGYIPGHLPRYWLYPFVPDNWMLHDVMSAPAARLGLAGLLSAWPLLFLLRRNWRFALAYLGFYYVFIAPVMIGASSFPNYLYGAALPVAAFFAYVFRRSCAPGASGRAGTARYAERGVVRAAALCLLAVLALHSATLQFHFYEIGARQQRVYAGLAAIVRSYDDRAGNTETKFAIIADRENAGAWEVLYRSFWPPHYLPARNVGGLDLSRRVTVHTTWPGHWNEGPRAVPADAVQLRMTTEGHLVAE